MSPSAAATAPETELLREGMRLTQEEFHRLYEASPAIEHAELLDGVVHLMASPTSLPRHTVPQKLLLKLIFAYEDATRDVFATQPTTVLLGPADEVEPDALLALLPARGGRSAIAGRNYVVGPPELVVEVAASSAARDLGVKRDTYRRAGVIEYIVWETDTSRFHWWQLSREGDDSLPADPAGVVRSRVFPGFWLDVAALLLGDYAAARATGALGLASPDHAAFAAL